MGESNTAGRMAAKLAWLARSGKGHVRRLQEERMWRKTGYGVPAPIRVKWSVLQAYGFPSDVWIETGTFFGDTTNFLANSAGRVYSIEPSPSLAERARQRFRERPNITIIEGLSEECFADLLRQAKGRVSLWLDGHYSGGPTHKGPLETPIATELQIVRQLLGGFDELRVFVDDFRCFASQDVGEPDYPKRSWLVEWADSCQLNWTVENDIFVATKPRRG